MTKFQGDFSLEYESEKAIKSKGKSLQSPNLQAPTLLYQQLKKDTQMSVAEILTIAASIANHQAVKLPAMSKQDFERLLRIISASK